MGTESENWCRARFMIFFYAQRGRGYLSDAVLHLLRHTAEPVPQNEQQQLSCSSSSLKVEISVVREEDIRRHVSKENGQCVGLVDFDTVWQQQMLPTPPPHPRPGEQICCSLPVCLLQMGFSKTGTTRALSLQSKETLACILSFQHNHLQRIEDSGMLKVFYLLCGRYHCRQIGKFTC